MGQPPVSLDIVKYAKTRGQPQNGKSKSNRAIKITLFVLLALTIWFLTDYKNVDIAKAILARNNVKVLFSQPKLTYSTWGGSLQAVCDISLRCAPVRSVWLLVPCCALSLANPCVANITKLLLYKGSETILWVLIFTVAAGLSSVAAVIGLTFLVPVMIKHMRIHRRDGRRYYRDLKASGASSGKLCFSYSPSSISLTAWTLPFKSFTNALAVGAAAKWAASALICTWPATITLIFASWDTSHILSWPR